MLHRIIFNANKAVGCGIFRRFSSLDKCRPEATGDVISGMVLDYVGADVPASFGDNRLNSDRIGMWGRHFDWYHFRTSKPTLTGG